MSANWLVLGYLVAMVYWWGMREGAFSAWLHLVVTVVAGALALALWEPTVLGLWMRWLPSYSWGLGLIVGFLFWLILLRKLSDWIVVNGVGHHLWVDRVVGGCFGLMAGILTAGITLIGIGFLPLPPDAGGYQRLVVNAQGRVVENVPQPLWIPVDRWAIGFYERLSNGAFYGGYPISQYQPDLVTQAALFRLHVEPNASLIATPEEVEAYRVYRSPVTLGQLPSSSAAVQRLQAQHGGEADHLVLVQTQWRAAVEDPTETDEPVEITWVLNRGTYDHDGALRVAPTQIRLVTAPLDNDQAWLHAPIGWVEVDPQTDQRRLVLHESDSAMVHTDRIPAKIGWVFAVPDEQLPLSLLIRHLRLNLPRAVQDAGDLVQALGHPVVPLGDPG